MDKSKLRCGKFSLKSHKKRLQGQTYKNKKKLKFFPVAVICAVLILITIGVQSLVCVKRFTTIKSFEASASEKSYKAMAVVETSSNRLLDGYMEETRLPMASTTKIITAIVTIENCEDLDKEVLVPDEAIGIEGSSMYLRWGESHTIKDLLFGLMLPSGNDAAVAISIIVGGSEEKFVEMMNGFVTNLGLKNTHLTNPHGLHNDEHFTTAHDLAIITSYAMKNEIFREIVGTKFKEVKGSEEGKPRYLKTKQHLMDDVDLKNSGITITGVKTGFTPEAGRCLVTSATNSDGMEIVSVVLNSPDMFNDSKKVVMEAFKNYRLVKLVEPKKHIATVAVLDEEQSVNLYNEEGFSFPLTQEEEKEVKVLYDYPTFLRAPIKKGDVVGSVKVVLNQKEIFNTSIFSLDSVEKTDYNSILDKIIEEF